MENHPFKYYFGEESEPKDYNQWQSFFWKYERVFYNSNPAATQEEYDEWLHHFLHDYIIGKMMLSTTTDCAMIVEEYKKLYLDNMP